MKRIAHLLALSLFLPTVAMTLAPRPALAQQTSVRIRLTGPAIGRVLPEGKSEYKVAGAKRSFRVEVKANVPNGTVLDVTVNGALVGTVTMNLGVGSLSLATERRQVVPTITPGTNVGVWTEDDQEIVSGTF